MLINTILFKKSSLRIRLLVCLVLSILLMSFSPHHFLVARWVYSTLDIMVSPLRFAVNVPVNAFHHIVDVVAGERRLLEENNQLRSTNFLLRARLQGFSALEKENSELRQLLQSSSHVSGKTLTANLLAVDTGLGLQQMIVNKGKPSALYIGQPVLDAYGVMGQVVDVGLVSSKVLLLTDSKSAIPVKSYRNGVRSVAAGQGNGLQTLVLLNVPETADIRSGDLFVSSGLGQRYPAGYPVGTVVSKKAIAGKHELSIELRPLAHLDRVQQVLLVWPQNAELAKVVQQQLRKPLS